MYIWYREKYFFTNRKFVTIHLRSTLLEKTEIWKNVKFGSVALDAIMVAIMVVVLMLVYHVILCKFILYLKLILRK